MEHWAPLAPTKRTSTTHTSTPSLSNGYSLTSPTTEDQGNGNDVTFEGSSLIGNLPCALVFRILTYVPLFDLPACALAGRSLAAVIADENLWKRRIEGIDWHEIEGLPVEFEDATPPVKAEYGGGSQLGTSAYPTSSYSHASQAPASAEEDEWGDFSSAAGEGITTDLNFGSIGLSPPKPLSGGSLANGIASVSFGSPDNQRPDLFVQHTQGLLGTNSGKSTLNPLPSDLANKLPLCSHNSISFLRLRCYTRTLKPFIRELEQSIDRSSSSTYENDAVGYSFAPLPRASLLANIIQFGSPPVLGMRNLFCAKLWNSITTLCSTLLSEFEGAMDRATDAERAASLGADTSKAVERAEADMRLRAYAFWKVGSALESAKKTMNTNKANEIEAVGMEAVRVFLERRDIFYKTAKYDPLDNLVERSGSKSLDFTAMDKFMSEIFQTVRNDGQFIIRVFPPQQDILLVYARRVADEVIGAYVRQVLVESRSSSVHLYLRACAATFVEALRLIDVLSEIEQPKGPLMGESNDDAHARQRRHEAVVTRYRCEDVIYQMWETNMDAYLQQEREWVKDEMNKLMQAWITDLNNNSNASQTDSAFLRSQNPAAVKRSVLTGFKDVLLLPVTVVPRTAGYVGGAMMRSAGTGIFQLNPMKWQSGGATAGTSSPKSDTLNANMEREDSQGKLRATNLEKGYINFSNENAPTQFGNTGVYGDDEDERLSDDLNEKDAWNAEIKAWESVAVPLHNHSTTEEYSVHESKLQPSMSGTKPQDLPGYHSNTPILDTTLGEEVLESGKEVTFSRMQLFLSLDVSLQVIHINRDSIKRVETFSQYPDVYGYRVKSEMEELAATFFHSLGEGHISPGLFKAISQIKQWKPSEQDSFETPQAHVTPLVHFFELVHVADTIQQMVHVYFDRELARFIDRNDFLNLVVREKKRFESALDEQVAEGLNAGVDLLMEQVEHIITTRQNSRDFYPEPGSDMDLDKPTKACSDALSCLKTHCDMLKGSTDKQVLEVFYQEVGIRLHGIICKHLKRQIVSLDGGFKVIADLNAYHAFGALLRQSSIMPFFDALKMLGNLYIIDSPKELAQIARDASMFGGTLSPEDLYEFLQARCDFKAIEPAIDKEMYGFKVSEDCIIC